MPTQNKPICNQVNNNCNQFKCNRKKKGAKRTTPMQSTLKPPVPLIAINYERKQIGKSVV